MDVWNSARKCNKYIYVWRRKKRRKRGGEGKEREGKEREGWEGEGWRRGRGRVGGRGEEEREGWRRGRQRRREREGKSP